MNLNRRELKANAKELMRTTAPRPIWVALVYLLITLAIGGVSTKLSGTVYEIDYNILAHTGDMTQALVLHPEKYNALYGILQLAIEFISMVLAAGFTIYTLHVTRRLASGFGNLFDGFSIFFRVVWLNVLEGILVFLQTLLLVIPGIIAAYAYRQALYLLLDHPDWGAYRCLKESRAMMRGHKWELFVLDLSFIGWALLCVFPPVMIYVEPYTGLTYAEYYNRLAGVNVPLVEAPDSYGSGNGEKPPWEY